MGAHQSGPRGTDLSIRPFGASDEDLTVLGALSKMIRSDVAKIALKRVLNYPNRKGVANRAHVVSVVVEEHDIPPRGAGTLCNSVSFLTLAAEKETSANMAREYSLPKLAYGLNVGDHSQLRTLIDLHRISSLLSQARSWTCTTTSTIRRISPT